MTSVTSLDSFLKERKVFKVRNYLLSEGIYDYLDNNKNAMDKKRNRKKNALGRIRTQDRLITELAPYQLSHTKILAREKKSYRIITGKGKFPKYENPHLPTKKNFPGKTASATF